MIKNKVFRGTITDWQVHHLSIPQEKLDQHAAETNKERMLPLIITGTIMEDPSGRGTSGCHMRTSALTVFNEAEGYCETNSSIYRLSGENGKDMLPDLGDGVLSIFY